MRLSLPMWALAVGVFSTGSVAFAAKPPQHLVGTVAVVDGDTLRLDGERIRLSGYDAPERKQTCDLDGRATWCGEAAKRALVDLIKARPVSCTSQGRDRYRRILATCSVAGQDIGAWMVENGFAMAYRKYSTVYVAAEQRAQAAGRGIWATDFTPPWTWRKTQKRTR